MKRKLIRNRSGGNMGFDIDGTPLPMSSDDVRRRSMAALDDPKSELVAFIMRQNGDLLLHIMGEPSRETLNDVRQVLEKMVHGYEQVLKGQ